MIPRDGKDVGRSSVPWRHHHRSKDRDSQQKASKGAGQQEKVENNAGWGMNILHDETRRSRTLKGSFVDLLGDSLLSELHLVDGEGRSSSATTTFSSCNTEHMSSSTSADSSRASSSSVSSSHGSSENVEGFLAVEDMQPSSTGRTPGRRVRGVIPDKDGSGLENAKELVSDVKEESEKSRNERLFLAVKKNDKATVKCLHEEGISLESVDKYGMTPIMVACLDENLCNMVRSLITFGANVHAYRHGMHAGYPLHHAAKRGHVEIVSVLLESGANALAVNDDGQTALDMARIRGHASAVRVIEDWICLFKGVLRQITDNAGSQIMKRIWAVVLPTDADPSCSRQELVVYNSRKVPKPEAVILLGSLTGEVEEPDSCMPDPSLVVSDKLTKTKFKFFAQVPGDRKQLMAFYEACKGIGQPSEMHPPRKSISMPVLNSDKLVPVLKKSSVFPEESLSRVQNKQFCLVCRKVAAEAMSIPCGHLSACMTCLSGLKKTTRGCPVCQAPIQQVVKVLIQQ